MADVDSTLVFLVAQVVKENTEAMLRPVGGGPAMTPSGQPALRATEPELAGLAGASRTSEPSAGYLMKGDQEPISLLLCSLDPVCSTKSTSIWPAAIRVNEQLQHLTDRPLPADDLAHR